MESKLNFENEKDCCEIELSEVETAYREFAKNPLKPTEEGEPDLLDKLIEATFSSFEFPIFINETEKQKARTIIKELDGLSITDAKILLGKCEMALSTTKINLI